MSAIRPNTIAPTAEAASVTEFSSDCWAVDMCHSVFSSETTIPMMKRS
jgi:hypothetical protein